MDLWIREVYVARSCRVNLATGFDFRETNRAGFLVSISPTLLSASYLVSLILRKGEEDYFPQNFVYVLRTTITWHVVSFIDFYFQPELRHICFLLCSCVMPRVTHNECNG